jgi:hypothetical protein
MKNVVIVVAGSRPSMEARGADHAIFSEPETCGELSVAMLNFDWFLLRASRP